MMESRLTVSPDELRAEDAGEVRDE